jgi:hypothetical protein
MRLTIGMLRDLAQEPLFPEIKEELLQVFRQWKKQEGSGKGHHHVGGERETTRRDTEEGILAHS